MISSYFVSKAYSGEKFSLGLKFGKVFSSYGSMDTFLETYKNGNIKEEKEISEEKAYIHQGYKNTLKVIIPYDKKNYACVEFKLKGIEDDTDFREAEKSYKELYETKEVKEIIDSIKLEKIKKSGDKLIVVQMYNLELNKVEDLLKTLKIK